MVMVFVKGFQLMPHSPRVHVYLERAGRPRPYYDNDAMDVVRHDCEGIEMDIGIMIRQFLPPMEYYLAIIVQIHFTVINVSE